MKKKTGLLVAMLLLLVLAAGCGNDKSHTVVTGEHYYQPQGNTQTDTEQSENVSAKDQETEITVTSDLYLIISNDMTTEHMILEQMASGKQYMYYYGLSTRFLDKYGNHTTASCFEPGRVVNIGTKDEEGRLKEVQISDRVWEYSDIVRYSIDEERGIFQIADSKYSYDEDLLVVSDGEKIKLSSLNKMDELRVVGMDKKILSVSVTTGHGKLQLENTRIFEGSFIQIGDKIFAEVTPAMNLEIPEGTYLVTVANDGYGGSKEVTIERGQTTVLDLDELKGEGPKKGKVLFAVDVAGAVLQIDGEVVDYDAPLELQYGVHSVKVTAAGYEKYSKKLVVNSEEATILIEMEAESSNASTSSSTSTDNSSSTDSSQNSTTAGSLAGSVAGSTGSNTSSGSSTSTESSASGTDTTSSDYLSTLSELLKLLTD